MTTRGKQYHIVLLLFVFLLSIKTVAQVTVAGSTGANGGYATLSAAFTAINGSAQAGNNITISITGNTTEPATGATLNAGTWTSVRIYPSGGSRTISGTTNASVPLVKFDGADNVTVSGSNNLTFSNAQTNAGFTFYFINDAQNNRLDSCTILSANSMTGSAGGTINFSSGSSSGNNNNSITYCNIGPTSAGTLPSQGITSGAAGIDNSSNTVSNCNIYDYFNATSYSAGIYIAATGASWTISNNRFYQTALRTYSSTTANYNSAILLSTTGSGFTVTNNIIGYASSAGTGTYTITNGGTNTPKFSGIDISVGSGTQSKISSNTIAAISLTSTISVAQVTSSSTFLGICLRGGNAMIGGNSAASGNIIGDSTVSGSITVNTSGSTLASGIVGIGIYLNTNPNPTDSIRYNFVSSITATGSANSRIAAVSSSIGTSSALLYIMNNTIGGTSSAAGALYANGAGSGSYSHGIDVLGTQTAVYVSRNLIRNLYCVNTNNTSNASASVVGIVLNSTLANSSHTVVLNTIHSLFNTNSTSAPYWVMGIYIQTSSTTSVSIANNLIHSFSIQSTDVGATMAGIATNSATTSPVTFTNNMIRLGINSTGASVTTSGPVYGIYSPSNNQGNMYFNSIYIGGTGVSSSSALTAAYYTANTGSVASVVAYNIFVNQRSSGGVGGPHVAFRYNVLTGWTFNYNVYFVPNTTGTAAAGSAWAINATPTTYTVFTTWQTAITPFETNSVYGDPNFVNVTGGSSAVDMHISCPNPSALFSGAVIAAPTAIDYDLDSRSTTTKAAGADEFAAERIYSKGIGTCASTTWVTTLTCGSTTGGTSWAYFVDPTSKRVVAAINPNGSNLGTVTVNMYNTDSTFSALQTNTDHYGFNWNYLNKIWNITASGTITVGNEPMIRFYYTDSEMVRFRAAAAVGCSPCDPYSDQDIVLLQATGLTENCSAADNGTASQYNFYWYKNPANYTIERDHILQLGLNISAPAYTNTVNYYGDISSGVGSVVNTSNSEFNGRYFQAMVGSFSEFRLFLPPQRLLPVRWLALEGQMINGIVKLNWRAIETETVTYDIERSADGLHFEKIASASANTVNAVNDYVAYDAAPFTGKNYYRIKSKTLEGRFYYSKVILLIMKSGVADLQVFPNPVADQMNILYRSKEKKGANLVILDATGKVLKQQAVSVLEGNNNLSLNITNFPSGYYLLQIRHADGTSVNTSFIKK